MLMFEERVNAEGEWRGRKGRMKGGRGCRRRVWWWGGGR